MKSMPRLRLAVSSGACAALLLCVAGAPAQAQKSPAAFDPHHAVSSQGPVLPMPKRLQGRTQEEAFEGFAPATAGRFEDTGAAIDGATPVLDEAADFQELMRLPALGTGDLLKTVIGADGRTLVTPTTSYPARAAVLITFDGGRCSGWLYGPNVVATTGHCVHTGGTSGHWMTNVRVYPGRNGSSAPYGSCTARALYSVVGWTTSKDETYDYGAVKLNCTVGNTTGYFGFFWQAASLTGLSATVEGYPGDKPLTLWKAGGSISMTQDRQVFYLQDTYAGQSGSPVFQNRSGCGQCSMAIHAYGLHGGSPHNQYNHGTRITQSVFNNLLTWKNAP
jgi:glutamyl endopeptidase